MRLKIVIALAVIISVSSYVAYSGAFFVQDTPEPLVQDTPEPLVQDTPEPLVQDTPEPLVQDTPEPLVQDVSSGNNRLAIEFYKQISNNNENIFFSPPALYATLAALYEGADGDAAAQIQKLLSLETDRKKRHNAISQFLSDIYRHDPYVRPEMAGVLWLPDGTDTRDVYQKSVKDYGLDVRSGISEEMIDDWAAEETNGRITDVVDSDNLDAGAAVITNVAYFEGEWLHHFGPRPPGYFGINVEEYVRADFMDQRHYYEAALFNNAYMVKIPYKGERLSMITIGPLIHDIKFLEESLTMEIIEEWKAELQSRDRILYFPKFAVESNHSIKKPLENLGVIGIFDSDINLDGIDANHNLHISGIFQKSFINITESGTDVPFIDWPGTLADNYPKGPNFGYDEPFIFIIQDDTTGAILFMGRVLDPTA